MKKYIISALILITVIITITACDSDKTYYCKNCDNEVIINEAVLVDSLPTCDHCGNHSVYYKQYTPT